MGNEVDLLETIAELEHLRQKDHQKIQEKDAQLQAISKLVDLSNNEAEQLIGVMQEIAKIFNADFVSLYEQDGGLDFQLHCTTQDPALDFQPPVTCNLLRKAKSGRCSNVSDISKLACTRSKQCGITKHRHAGILLGGLDVKDKHYCLIAERGENQTFSRSEMGQFQSLIPIVTQAISLSNARQDKKRLIEELRNAQKLEAIGQLAGGIAHEINTPSQYIGDNLNFIELSTQSLFKIMEPALALHDACKASGNCPEHTHALDDAIDEHDLDFLIEEIPLATRESIEGVQQISSIVRAMKEFAHPSVKEKTAVDLNKTIQTALTVSRNEWKNVAEVKLQLDEKLPLTPCLAAEINQVFLNIIVNAAHAITEHRPSEGIIEVQTRKIEDTVEVRISDNGGGIPARYKDKIFNLFFTTKDIGVGSGQGLAIAHDIIVNKHNGYIGFETIEGEGTTFIVQLPL